jgi:formamidopyrimidine-DNA glycosylase
VPEAAEVETLRRQLLPFLPLQIDRVEVRGHRSVRSHPASDLNALSGVEIFDADRRGKWLGLRGATCGLRVHLRMSGRLHLVERELPLEPHDHVVFDIQAQGKAASLRFHDPRTFGEVAIWDGGVLGTGVADVLDDNLADALATHSTRRSVKALLLDQRSVVQGLGNIYVDEVCHLSRIDPAAPWDNVDANKRDTLARLIPHIIETATEHRGTALADEGWLDLYQELGNHGQYLHVHGRQTCADCSSPVTRQKVAGRSTYTCRCCLENG